MDHLWLCSLEFVRLLEALSWCILGSIQHASLLPTSSSPYVLDLVLLFCVGEVGLTPDASRCTWAADPSTLASLCWDPALCCHRLVSFPQSLSSLVYPAFSVLYKGDTLFPTSVLILRLHDTPGTILDSWESFVIRNTKVLVSVDCYQTVRSVS